MTKTDLSVVAQRSALKPKPNRMPYWQRLRPGCFVGYRPVSDGAAGNWAAKAYVDSKEQQQALGSFGEFPANERFAKAKAAAEAFVSLQESGGRATVQAITVADAVRNYLATHPKAKAFFRLSVDNDPVAKIKLQKLRRQDLVEWRERLEARPLGYGKAGKRAPASINREMAPLRAALRKVLAAGTPNTEAAWQEAITPISAKIATRRRTLYVDKGERLALLANVSDPAAAAFVRALCVLPVRPGALAQLPVNTFNRKANDLTIPAGIDKGHGERRLHLSIPAAELLIAQARDKTPATLLFRQANLKPWTSENWNAPIREAAVAAKLDPTISTYTLRHSIITDLVTSGVPTLTVAQLAGTSVKMIEDHYGHLLQEAARRALDALAL